MNITNALYRAARLSADARAGSKGTGAVAKRIVRKQVYRRTNSVTRKVLRSFGL